MRSPSRLSLVVWIAVLAFATAACSTTPPRYELSAADCADVRASVETGRGRLVAYDRGSGRELWTADGGFGWIPPVARADVVYLVRTAPAGDHHDLVALDAATGATRWSSRLDGPVRASFLVSYGRTSVAVERDYLGPMIVLEPSGRGPDLPWGLVTGTDVPLSPGRRGRLLTSRNELMLVDPDAGAEVWRTQVPALAGAATDIDIDLVRVGEVLVVPTRGLPSGISGIDAATGLVRWTHQGAPTQPIELLGARSWPTPVVVIDDDRDRVVLDAVTGKRVLADVPDGDLDVHPERYLDDVRPRWSPPEGSGAIVGTAIDAQRGYVLWSAEQPAIDAARALVARCEP